ncbi:sulfatase-like hydrolase/transferase [Catenuloplanes atrovinosus]|uniref:Arylsulfatase A-like enzyme n=1 Tax=Catenuloplanes atrovinosus TaxID=137266 RepID=A0AAE3YKE5_9ACTN|nr:sulfatase-like hydrolase/transferase [Catenuloplanes atrovinosus]MDR7274142.1 arylsulfatase A-like enzyme [Catenuloplanes atrovinosus]
MMVTRRRVLAAALLTGLTMLTAAPAVTAAPVTRPNVLLVVLDDAGIGQTEVMRHTRAWLGRTGREFTHAVATTPSCCPSRSSILSGRYVHNTGVTQQDRIGVYDHDRTLQRELKRAGYATAAAGKLFNGWELAKKPPHIDHWALQHGGYVKAHFNVGGTDVYPAYSTTFTGRQVTGYIDRFERENDRRPWFIYAGFVAPHSPYTPEPKYADAPLSWRTNPAGRERDRADKPAYVRRFRFSAEEGARTAVAQMRTLLSVDDQLEAIRRRLAATGELDDTVVVLLSDNGKSLGEHGLPSKFVPYQGSIRVPLLLWWPGRVPAGRDTRLAPLIDVVPTVLELAGLAPGYRVDGRSLLTGARRDRVLLEYWHDAVNGSYPTWASTYAPGRYQYVEYQEGPRVVREYYDLHRDPWQLTNLLGDRGTAGDPDVGPLSATLARDRTCVGAGDCP